MASAVSALGRLIKLPVTTISCSSVVSEAAEAGACWPIAEAPISEPITAPTAVRRRVMRAASSAGSDIPGQLTLREILIVVSLRFVIGDIVHGSVARALD